MATQYRIRAKDSITGDTYFVTVIGTFDPITDLNNPATDNPPDPDTVTIVGATQIAEEFTLKDSFGIQAVTIMPSSLSAFDGVTYNYTDETTWWQESLEVTNELLTTSNDLTFNFANAKVININEIIDLRSIPSSKCLQVKVNGNTIDYNNSAIASVDYLNGTITFTSSQAGNTVTASYAYVDMTNDNRSTWTLTPATGASVAITGAKVKISKNITLTDPIVFTIGINPAIIPGGIAAQRTYRSLKDFIGFSSEWEVLPAIGEYSQDIVHLIYDYKGSIILDANLGMYATLKLQNNVVQTGEIALSTIQCIKVKG